MRGTRKTGAFVEHSRCTVCILDISLLYTTSCGGPLSHTYTHTLDCTIPGPHRPPDSAQMLRRPQGAAHAGRPAIHFCFLPLTAVRIARASIMTAAAAMR